MDDNGQPGDDVGLGNDLGVDEDETGFWVGFEWRMAEKHRLGVTYSSFTLTGERVIDEEITIGDEIYPVDATITTEHKIELIPILYSYSFVNNESNEFAVTAGVHWTAITLSLTGSTSLSDEDLTATADRPPPTCHCRSSAFATIITSPTSGPRVSGQPSSRSSSARTRLDASGSLVNARAYGEYRFTDRFGAGFAIDAFKLDVEADEDPLDRRVRARLLGSPALRHRTLLVPKGTLPFKGDRHL